MEPLVLRIYVPWDQPMTPVIHVGSEPNLRDMLHECTRTWRKSYRTITIEAVTRDFIVCSIAIHRAVRRILYSGRSKRTKNKRSLLSRGR